MEKTLHSVFVKDTMSNVTCSLPTVAQQARCFADPGIHDVMRHAIQLVETCRESFMYEPWQCTTSKVAFKKGTTSTIQNILNLTHRAPYNNLVVFASIVPNAKVPVLHLRDK